MTMNLLKQTPTGALARLTDWELLDLYAQRHRLDIQAELNVRHEVEYRADRSEWFNDEATRR
jgi:hypothetical protein